MSSVKKTRKPNTDDRPLLRLVMWHGAFKAAHWHTILKGEITMKYKDLRLEEKQELRGALFDSNLWEDEYSDFASLSAEEQDIVRNCEWAEDIPESVMESAFGMYDFVPQDFWCNLESEVE